MSLEQTTFITIDRVPVGSHKESLHVADDTNETQWLKPNNDETAFEAYCYHCAEWHTWRQIWVIA